MIEFGGSLDELLSGLAPYERRLVTDILAGGINEEEFVKLWLERVSNTNVSPHGVLGGRSSLADKFKEEFRILVCTQDPKYKDVRERFTKHGGTVGSTSMIAIGTAISNYIGVSAALLTPAVAVTAYAIAKVGRNAWCAQVKGSA